MDIIKVFPENDLGFEIQTYADCDKEQWNHFVKECNEAWFWHTSEFLEAWPQGENVSFCIKKNGEILLEQVLFCTEIETDASLSIKRWHRIPYVKKEPSRIDRYLLSVGGLAKKEGLSDKAQRKLQRVYIEAIRGFAKANQVRRFGYCIEATCAKSWWPECCPTVNPLIFWGYQNKISQAYIIDLTQSEEDIFKNYVQTTRNLINRCTRDDGIRIEEAKPTQEDLDKYYSLHVETYTRTGATPHPKSYFEHIFFDILPKEYCHILFLYRGNRLVVAHNMLLFKEVAMYWTGCSVSEKGEGESRLLMHEQIMHAKKMGCKYFEVGECFPNISDGKLKGLNDYKKSFGGMIHPIFAGEFIL